MPRRKLHDEEQDDEVTTVGQNDDLGPLDDYDDEDGFPNSEYSARRLFDDPEDDEEEYYEDEEEELYEEE